jgi:hypothetical protein
MESQQEHKAAHFIWMFDATDHSHLRWACADSGAQRTELPQ